MSNTVGGETAGEVALNIVRDLKEIGYFDLYVSEKGRSEIVLDGRVKLTDDAAALLDAELEETP